MIPTSTLAACGLLYSLIATGSSNPPEIRQAAEARVDQLIAIANRNNRLEEVTQGVTILSNQLVRQPGNLPAFIDLAAPICAEVQ